MAAASAANIPKREVHLDCGDYLLRTVTADDASERWAGWMSDPKNLRLLNAAPKAMTRQDIVTYISRFDQRSHLLIGIFEKQGDSQIGFFRLDIDHRLKRCLMFLLIGEQKYRHWRVTDDIRGPFQDYIFDVLGLNTMLATVLVSNRAMTRYMLKSGWNLDKTLDRNIKSQTADALLDLSYLSLSREAWQAWKKTNDAEAIIEVGEIVEAVFGVRPCDAPYHLFRCNLRQTATRETKKPFSPVRCRQS